MLSSHKGEDRKSIDFEPYSCCKSVSACERNCGSQAKSKKKNRKNIGAHVEAIVEVNQLVWVNPNGLFLVLLGSGVVEAPRVLIS